MNGLPACCLDMEITLEHLFFPHRMAEDGLEFVLAHGLTAMSLGELQMRVGDRDDGTPGKRGVVHLKHRCQHLTDQGQCDIYATRPKICRDFDCATKGDCACKGKGMQWAPIELTITPEMGQAWKEKEAGNAVSPDPGA